MLRTTSLVVALGICTALSTPPPARRAGMTPDQMACGVATKPAPARPAVAVPADRQVDVSIEH